MTTKKNMVKQVLMSALTAGIFSFSFVFTSCNDDEVFTNNVNNTEDGSDKIGNYADYEPYGLTYHNFDSEDDVRILNADTTEIAVKKSLADKLGITNFKNHPIGIWDDPSHLAFGRKGIEQELVGDTYIIKVSEVTTAELIGDKSAQLVTDWYVNNDQASVATRAANDNIPEYAAKYVDNDGMIHPAVVQYTDPYGYDKDYHVPGVDQPVAAQTRAAESGEYRYMTAEDMIGGTRASIHPRILSINNTIEFDHNIPLGKDSKDSINIAGEIPISFALNYFLTIEGGWKWDFPPHPYLKKFETGFDGTFEFHPSATIGFKKELKLPEDKGTFTLAKFKGYTFTFVVGVIPVSVNVDPALKLKFDASVKGSAHLKFQYDYANRFKAGLRYNGRWDVIHEFEELENEFVFSKPEVQFKAEAGIALFLNAEVKIYGVAGPVLGVGPRLGAEASMTLSPDGLDWNAEVNLKVQAWAGAKLEILGYELAEYKKTFDIAGPWTLLKFPSDGKEHKSPKVVREEYIANDLDKMLKEMDAKYEPTLLNRIENLAIAFSTYSQVDHDAAINYFYNGFYDCLTNKNVSPKKKVLPADANNADSREVIMHELKFFESSAKLSLKEYNATKVFIDMFADHPDFSSWDKNLLSRAVNTAYHEFGMKFKREPSQTDKDIESMIQLCKEVRKRWI